jgi:hypothetical protein
MLYVPALSAKLVLTWEYSFTAGKARCYYLRSNSGYLLSRLWPGAYMRGANIS